MPDGDNRKNLKYPKSVFFIITNEFCERFSYYGMKTVLSLYFTSSLLRYSENEATILYHVFAMLCYFFPLIGAIIADSYLGKFKTILYLSIVYALGSIVTSVASIPIADFPHKAISLLGLLLIAIGTGGIKPCVSSFGGDQFVLPEQEQQLQRFFSVFYFAINAGSMISTFLTPSLRNDVKCFGQDSCFPLAFGVPSILMILSVVIFVFGKKMYKMKEPSENIIVLFLCCIGRAIKNKITGNNSQKKEHWLQTADDKYSTEQISDIRIVLNVLYLYMPIPFFWALFDQQGSRWTFQATYLDGRIGDFFTIKPDQMQVLNPVLILAFIPLFETVVYPVMKKIGIRRPLQKLVIGGFLAALAFGCSAFLESKVEDSYAIVPNQGTANLRIFNSIYCDVSIHPDVKGIVKIPALAEEQTLRTILHGSEVHKVTINVNDSSCPYILKETEVDIKIFEKQDVAYFIGQEPGSLWISQAHTERMSKDADGKVGFRIFFTSSYNSTVSISLKGKGGKVAFYQENLAPNTVTNYTTVDADTYKIWINNEESNSSMDLLPGSINTILIHLGANKNIEAGLVNTVLPNTVHILWQIPQIMIITVAEIMFSITGLEFSFTQAPESMKSVVSAAWLLTVAFGNLIVVVISEIKFESRSYEFLLFAFLMVLDMFWFIYLSIQYKYVSYSDATDLALQRKNCRQQTDGRFSSSTTIDTEVPS